jgi:PilZ domain-containing protein
MNVPTGRYEKRTARAVTVEVLRLEESGLNERAVTENVSPRGARIVTGWNCAPGKHVLVTAPEEGVKSLARVVYCQLLESTKFAVGLQLVVRVEEWGKSASHE